LVAPCEDLHQPRFDRTIGRRDDMKGVETDTTNGVADT